jgi:acyl-CoA thioesterase FadM
MHYFHEIKGSDELSVSTSVLDSDRKRIHAGCDFLCPRIDGRAAIAEVMLLHVHQGEKPGVVSFPPEIEKRLESLKLSPESAAKRGVGSRKIELRRR